MRLKTYGAAALLFPFLAAAAPQAQGIPRTGTPPRLADFLGDTAPPDWLVIRDFRQREPKDGQPLSRLTTAYLAADGRSLYVAFVCQTAASEVRAHLSKRDRIAEDDSVGVFLDTQDSGRLAYYFFANPLGVQLDGIMKEGEGKDASFDTVWTSQARLTANRFVVLFTIPFRAIRSTSPGRWRLALTRYTPHTNESAIWPAIGRAKEGFIAHFAPISVPHHEGARLPYLITPYGFAARGGAERTVNGGLDAQFAFRNQFNLDVTLNPDYSQAESDDPRNTVNRRFEVYFPEKRPFFVDHATYFSTPETLLFSRRILRPTGGIRFTGSTGGWSSGFLRMDDRETGDGPAAITVGRLERSFRSRASVGGMFLRRATAFGENTVAAADGRWRFRDNWAVTAQTVRTEATEPVRATRQTGQANYVDVHRTGNHFFFSTTYRDRSPDFRDDLGFVPRVNLRQVDATAGYLFRPESGALLSYGPSVTMLVNRDWQGRLLDWSVGAPVWIDLARSTSIAIERQQGLETYLGSPFRTTSNSAYVTSEPTAWLAFNASHRWGRDLNYSPAAGVAPFTGAGQDQSAAVSIKPGKRLRIDHMLVRSALSWQGREVFESRLIRLRVNYQLTRRLSLRAITDVNRFRHDPALMDGFGPRPRAFDLMGAWQNTQGWILFAGYSHGVRRWDSRHGSAGGVAYIKLGYQFRP